ncbi:S-formylglutathione hydrolase [Colwelliaceae bacterium 6441]
MELLSDNKCFGGQQLRYQHQSKVNHCLMTFSVFLPPQAKQGKVPALYWLSGLTCTYENFITKAGAQQYAAKHGIALICPDTSPRGQGIPDDENQSYDFGLGAGFYVNATEPLWSNHYQMYDYVVNELPALVNDSFAVKPDLMSIFGHSMGGHGALTIALKNADRYRSVSAFAPICSSIRSPWGQKALMGYLGTNQQDWFQYDATELVKVAQHHLPMLIDQGDSDDFLLDQLKPELLQHACDVAHYPVKIRMQKGYDHSYFFISSFIGEHIAFHAKHLGNEKTPSVMTSQ